MMEIGPIAHIRSPFGEKFGIPRQSGLAEVSAEIVFLPEYRVKEAFRGLEGFSHIWLIWEFSEAKQEKWSPTVRPPMLGGNTRMGVFATRSPFRPNPIGLSSVKLEKILWDVPDAPVLKVVGADLMNGTPIYDIKPYLPYADSIPGASGGFAPQEKTGALEVCFPEELLARIPEELRSGLADVLSQDPRPRYQSSAERVYTMSFAGLEVSFYVDGGRLTVTEITGQIK